MQNVLTPAQKFESFHSAARTKCSAVVVKTGTGTQNKKQNRLLHTQRVEEQTDLLQVFFTWLIKSRAKILHETQNIVLSLNSRPKQL